MVLAHCTSPKCDLSAASILWKLQKTKVKIYKWQYQKIVGIELQFLYTAPLHNVTYP